MNELEQMIISNLAWIAIIIIAFLFVTRFIVIVPQSKKYIIERLGKYSRTLGPGISFLIPIIDSVAHRVDIRERVVPETLSKRINVVTKDNGVVSLDISAYYRVTEPQNLVYRITDIDSSVADAASRPRRNGRAYNGPRSSIPEGSEIIFSATSRPRTSSVLVPLWGSGIPVRPQ